jgi:thiol-disulfide isomerase/thioredoxin
MRTTLKRILGVLFAVMLLPMAAVAGDAGEAENEAPYVLDFFNGTALDLTQYEGKAILLNFFYQGCPYCMEEMDDIRQAFDAYDPSSLQIILVHIWYGEDADNTASVVSKYGLEELTVVEDEDTSLFSMTGLSGVPTNIFIDQDGYLHKLTYGLNFESFSQIFDEMGVPKRDDVEPDVESTPMPSASAAEAAPNN